MALDRWSHVDGSWTGTAERDRRSNISILDKDGASLLDLGFGEEHREIASEVLNRCRHQSQSPSRSKAKAAMQRHGAALQQDSVVLRRLMAGLGDSIDLADLAEAMDELRLSPARLRERGHVKAVDAELVPCFLEALAEQALQVRIATGTPGVAHSLDCAFFGHRRDGAWQTLHSDSARLRIDTSQIDSAWVVTVAEAANERTSLRLYDTQGRLLTQLSSVPGFVAVENPIWRTLVNALQD
jgi:putative heme degradation protein